MTSKIKILIAVGLLLAGALLAWYVQSLRADNARLNVELATAQTMIVVQATNLARLQAASQIVVNKQTQAKEQISALNKELQNATRRPGANYEANNQNKNSPRAALVAQQLAVQLAVQLNRMFNSTPAGGH